MLPLGSNTDEIPHRPCAVDDGSETSAMKVVNLLSESPIVGRFIKNPSSYAYLFPHAPSIWEKRGGLKVHVMSFSIPLGSMFEEICS